jgi:predicted CopG family antitoxin
MSILGRIFFVLDMARYYTYNTRIRRCLMQKKLTVTVDEEVYVGLYKNIGARKISKFIEELVKPHVLRPNLESAYAEMARDRKREKEALEWAELTFKDTNDEAE